MRFLLDENLHELVAATMNVLGLENGDEFLHIVPVAGFGKEDEEIPPICNEHGCDALITVNHKDFGAKKLYYQALLDSDVHVVVVRPGKMKFQPHMQVAFLASAYPHARALIAEANECVLVRMSWSSAVVRTIDQILNEVEGHP